MEKVWYLGHRPPGERRVVVTKVDGTRAKKLRPRNDLWNHSPDGFEWGYNGSGPAQLALALLADALDNDDLALDLHQAFKFQVVSYFPPAGWRMSDEDIINWYLRNIRCQGGTIDLSLNHAAGEVST